MSGIHRTARIVGTGMTPLIAGRQAKLNKQGVGAMVQAALTKALTQANIHVSEIDGLVAVPSLAEPRFMEAHYVATTNMMLPRAVPMRLRTIDTGGAGPVTALLEARRMILHEQCEVVAVVAGDAISSLPTDEFLRRADSGCQNPLDPLPSPVIPHGYGKVTAWHMEKYGVSRKQLAMCSVLMSQFAVKHPKSVQYQGTPIASVDQVLSSREVVPGLSVLECARRADGAAALVLASSHFIAKKHGKEAFSSVKKGGCVVLGGGEASGPLYPPQAIDEHMFSCDAATEIAYSEAQVSQCDIDFFGLYDCFPICLLRALEAVKICAKGTGGEYIEQVYESFMRTGEIQDFPVNTHGGLLAFGAPWEVPAMYNIIEAVAQLRGNAGNRQIPRCRRALVYGNGGIFSHSSIAILGNGTYN